MNVTFGGNVSAPPRIGPDPECNVASQSVGASLSLNEV